MNGNASIMPEGKPESLSPKYELFPDFGLFLSDLFLKAPFELQLVEVSVQSIGQVH